ncbi:COP9 signalosome complex subunit 8-like [Babylonia areolata]|uniref:COP9 signalosome complex subunit 8-like n=1 Tax=Babylonia areolata TaxID=304850 RepID=UPI003FD647E4
MNMAGDAEIDFVGLAQELETQELEAPGGVASPQQYGQLMALYLLHSDSLSCKFLWKRIPNNIKQANTELGLIWEVGQCMWKRNYPGIYEALKKDWSESVKPIMNALTENVRRQALNLVQLAYSSINVDDFAVFLGMPVGEAKQAAVSEGWTLDSQSKFLTPKKIESVSTVTLPNEQHLSVLTDYVSFLEN